MFIHSDKDFYAVVYRMTRGGATVPSLLCEADTYEEVHVKMKNFLAQQLKRYQAADTEVYADFNGPNSASVVVKDLNDVYSRDVETVCIVRVFTPTIRDFPRSLAEPEYAQRFYKYGESLVDEFKPHIFGIVKSLVDAGNRPGDILNLFDVTIKEICLELDAYKKHGGWIEGSRDFSWPYPVREKK